MTGVESVSPNLETRRGAFAGSACTRVAATIRDGMRDGTFGPGDRLVHRDLAERLGVSLGPVAQALRHLESAGLLEHREDGATYVPEWGDDDVLGAYTLREVLEVTASRLCAERATAEELAVLRVKLNRLQERLGVAPDGTTAEAEDRDFHRAIARFAHLPILLHFYDNVSLIQRTWADVSLLGVRPPSPEAALAQHPAIVEAIESRDPDEAERQGRLHMRDVIERWRESAGI